MKHAIIAPALFSISSAFNNLLVEEDLRFKWDESNNCGPRPHGPIYPLPNGEGDPHSNIFCDVMKDSNYITGYRCSGQCQTDKSISFDLKCSCHTKIGMILMPKDCAWTFIDDNACPTVSEEEQLDWECHHKTANCKHNKYLDPTSEINFKMPETDDDATRGIQFVENIQKVVEPVKKRDETHDERMAEILNIFRKIDMNNPTETILMPLILNLLEQTTKRETVINFSPNIEIKMPDNTLSSVREKPTIVFEMDKLQDGNNTVTFDLSESHTGSSGNDITTEMIETTEQDVMQLDMVGPDAGKPEAVNQLDVAQQDAMNQLTAMQQKISTTEARYKLYQWKMMENPDNAKIQNMFEKLQERLDRLMVDKQNLEESLNINVTIKSARIV